MALPALLPVRPTAADEPNLAPGWTRLHKADNLAAELGMRTLWVKDDSATPLTRSRTGSWQWRSPRPGPWA